MDFELIKAKKLYAQGKTAKEIASALKKSLGTIYRWIKDNKEEFEEARKLAGMTLDDVVDLLDETHKKILIEISKNPQEFKDPKTADALVKVASVVEKVTARNEKKKEQTYRLAENDEILIFLNDEELEKFQKILELPKKISQNPVLRFYIRMII